MQSVCDAVGKQPHIEVQAGVTVEKVARVEGGFRVLTADGRSLEAAVVAVAAPVDRARAMLAEDFAPAAAALAPIGTVTIESIGVVLPREKAWMPECAFLVPAAD